MPTFSIIVPVYNVQKYVEAALSSVAAQTFTDFEVVVVDDGSTDASGAIAEAFCAKDRRFRYLRQENGGLSAARNAGTALASGDYLYYMDSDDVIDPETLGLCHDEFARYGVDVVLFGAVPFMDEAPLPATLSEGGRGRRPEVSSPLSSEAFVMESVRQDRYFVSACCLVARRSAIGSLQFINGMLFEDNHFVTALLLDRKIMVSVLSQALFRRRYRPNSIMTSQRTIRHYDSLYRLVREMCALSFAALDPAPRDAVRSFVIGHLLGDLHNTSAQVGAGVGLRIRNIVATWYVATHVSLRLLTLKRVLLALLPELYRIRA